MGFRSSHPPYEIERKLFDFSDQRSRNALSRSIRAGFRR
jgi:hypothetical protein